MVKMARREARIMAFAPSLAMRAGLFSRQSRVNNTSFNPGLRGFSLRSRPTNVSRPQMPLKQTRYSPSMVSKVSIDDEAFVTCGNCGADEVVSASKIMERGTIKVRCSQCRHQWVAKASDALTYDGTPLLSAEEQKVEGKDGQINDQGLVKLYISGFGPKTDNVALRQAFEAYGEVKQANIIYDRVTRRSRGFGFVTLVGKSAATAAMDDLTGSAVLGGRSLVVREAFD